MAASGTLPAAPAPPERPRPDVLAYPSPTTSRFLIFLAALLSAGLWVGTWVHNQLLFEDWFEVVARCEQQALQQTATQPSLEGAIARENASAQCRAAADRRRAAFAVGGAGAAGAAGLVVLYLVPGVIERRRRLRPVVPGLEPASERVAALAGSAGLARPPALMLGTAAQRDGFSYGTPGRYRIALPRAVAVRWRSASLFDPLVRHELAHVAHRDVALAWLARSVWYALAPLLAVPLVVSLLSSDRSILGDYLWRTALLAVVVQLVSSALLRSREHDADLRAARGMGGPEAVAAVVAQVRQPGTAPWYRRLLANHPPPARRLAVLERPELVTEVTFLDGLTAAFLATLTFPLIEQVSVTFLMGSGRSDLAKVAAALLAGPLLGGSVGLGLWRAALVQRVAGGPGRRAGGAAGVAAGFVLGQVASLAQTGTGALGGVTHPPMLAVIALAGLGATVLTAGLGELWADAAPALRRSRTSWMVALAVGSVVFAAVLWAASSLELALDQAGWLVTRLWAVTVLASWPTIGAVAALAVAAGWALAASRQGAMTPAWLLERGTSRPWPTSSRVSLAEAVVPALAGGLVGAGVIIGVRVLTGPLTSDAAKVEHFYTYVWVAAAAGAAMTLTLALLVPRRGVGVGALAGPLASLMVAVGLLAVSTARGGGLDAAFVTSTVRFPLALGLILAVLVAPAGLLAWHQEQRLARIWPAAAALSLVAVLAVVGGRDALTRNESIPIPDGGDREQALALAEVTQYAATATQVQQRYSAVETAVAAIAADQTIDGPARAARIRAEVLVPLRALLSDAEAYEPPTPNIRSVHQAAVASLRSMTAAFETLAAAYETDDAAAFAAAQAKLDEGRRHASAWQAGLANLLAAAGMAVQGATGTTGKPGTATGDTSGPAPTTTLASAPPTELTSNARAEASATAPDSVDDTGNPVSYDAANVLDGDPSTAWRVKGSGRGAVVAVRLPAPARITQVGLIPGYAKTDPVSGKDRFGENRRIRAVRWHFSDGTIIGQRFQDQPTMQQIAVEVTASWLLVEIVATVPGDPDHDYTPMSDVSIVGTT
jgi:Zn-dependent protease with chaperone function